MTPDARAPWISFLLPVYAVGVWLDDCIASIVDQGVDGVEIVCVDDASTADDAARLERWRARLPHIVRVLTHPGNRGVSAARNTLLDNAQGTWLWFIDPDDLLEPGALRSLRAIVDAGSPDLVLCDFRTFASDPQQGVADQPLRAHVPTFDRPPGVPPGSRAELVGGLFRTGQLHAWSKIVRRDAWPASLRFPEGRVFEDLAVLPRLALAIDRFAVTSDVWIAYRQRQGSLLATLSLAKLEDWTVALDGYADEIRAARLGPEVEFEVAHFSARTLLRAVRRLRRLQPAGTRRPLVRRYIERWERSSPLGAAELSSAYLARGRLGRWLQLRVLFLAAGAPWRRRAQSASAG